MGETDANLRDGTDIQLPHPSIPQRLQYFCPDTGGPQEAKAPIYQCPQGSPGEEWLSHLGELGQHGTDVVVSRFAIW